jgi:hypothetical protein
MVVPRRCDKAIPISYPLKREPCDFRFWPDADFPQSLPLLGVMPTRFAQPELFRV